MNISKINSVILSLSHTRVPDQLRLPFLGQTELILRLRCAALRMTALLSFIFIASLPLLADAPVASSPNAADPLPEALSILQGKYPDFAALQHKESDHLSDLIARSKGTISLSTPESGSGASARVIVTALLPGNIVYWRLASFTPEKNWMDLGTQLEQASGTAGGIILDVRSNITPDDFQGAVQVLGFFAPQDETLSKYATSGSNQGVRTPDHPFHLPIIVLTNNQTAGAAEALAACLKSDGALVLGRATAGKGAVFDQQTLSNGQVLRYAVADIQLPDGTLLWDHPVVPDIVLTVDNHNEKGALVLIAHHDVLDVIGESAERHLMNEAALIQGVDPEWDEYLASLEKKPVLLSLPVIHDQVLISALDSLKAIRVSQKRSEPSTLADTPPRTSTSVQ